MNFFLAILGELVIVEFCVLWIWLKVLFTSIRNRDATLAHKRLLMTSFGLVLNAIAITGLIIFRAVEFLNGNWLFIPPIIGFYVILAVGNVMFIISAAIGQSLSVLKAFCVLTLLWTIFCIIASNF